MDESRGTLPLARDAIQAHDWPRALELFRQADRDSGLAAEDLESMGDAAWSTARREEAIEVLQRAYATCLAAGDTARGALLLAGGDPKESARALRRAVAGWQEVEAPYEVAAARALLADAVERQGDREGATLELQVARFTFAKLGALADTERIDARLAARPAHGQSESVRGQKRLLFTDIVKSTNLVEAIGDDAWLDLVAWHDQTLRSLFASHHGQEVDHAGDGFFVAFEDADAAIGCAIAIQRRLAEHRRSQGFAPQVRIGCKPLSPADPGPPIAEKGSTRRPVLRPRPRGARSSPATAEALSLSVATSNPRTVTLKGISDPVAIVTVEWRPRA